jgi:hypothetical protein
MELVNISAAGNDPLHAQGQTASTVDLITFHHPVALVNKLL